MADKVYEGAKRDPLFEGDKLKVRGYEFIIPALSWGNYERMTDEIEFLQVGDPKTDTKKRMEAVFKIGHAALAQNYLDLTPDQAKEIFSPAQMGKVFRIAIGAQEAAEGPSRPTSGQTGESSTQQ